MVGVGIFRQFLDGLPQLPLGFLVDQPGQLRCRLRYDIPAVAGDERGAHHCAVFVHDVRVADQVIRPFLAGPCRKAGQARRKQKKRNAPLQIKRGDLGQNGKRRVIQHHGAFRVVVVLIVTAGVERPHDLVRVDAVLFARPVPDNGINAGWSVAVVRGFLRLEFFHEFLI